jgi:hypothetical protein
LELFQREVVGREARKADYPTPEPPLSRRLFQREVDEPQPRKSIQRPAGPPLYPELFGREVDGRPARKSIQRTAGPLINPELLREQVEGEYGRKPGYRTSGPLLNQPTGPVSDLLFVQERIQHAIAREVDSDSTAEGRYRELYTTGLEVGSIAASALAEMLGVMGQPLAGVLFDSAVALSSIAGDSNQASLVELDEKHFKVSGRLWHRIGDALELSKDIAAADRHDPMLPRKLETLGRMITEIVRDRGQLIRLRIERPSSITVKAKNSKLTK